MSAKRLLLALAGLVTLGFPSADDPIPPYDMVDAHGRLERRVVLPRATHLLGFGKSTVYLIRTDDDDLQWLQRYALD